MLAHGSRAAGQRATSAYLMDLQGLILEAHFVVIFHGALELQEKDLLHIVGVNAAPAAPRSFGSAP